MSLTSPNQNKIVNQFQRQIQIRRKLPSLSRNLAILSVNSPPHSHRNPIRFKSSPLESVPTAKGIFVPIALIARSVKDRSKTAEIGVNFFRFRWGNRLKFVGGVEKRWIVWLEREIPRYEEAKEEREEAAKEVTGEEEEEEDHYTYKEKRGDGESESLSARSLNFSGEIPIVDHRIIIPDFLIGSVTNDGLDELLGVEERK